MAKKKKSNFWNEVFNENKYCPNCKQNVVPAKKIEWLGIMLAFIFGLLVAGILGAIVILVIALLLQSLVSPKQCPMCGYKFSMFRQMATTRTGSSFNRRFGNQPNNTFKHLTENKAKNYFFLISSIVYLGIAILLANAWGSDIPYLWLLPLLILIIVCILFIKNRYEQKRKNIKLPKMCNKGKDLF